MQPRHKALISKRVNGRTSPIPIAVVHVLRVNDFSLDFSIVIIDAFSLYEVAYIFIVFFLFYCVLSHYRKTNVSR